MRNGILTPIFAVDKSDFTNDLFVSGGWNAYCLAKTSDKFAFYRES